LPRRDKEVLKFHCVISRGAVGRMEKKPDSEIEKNLASEEAKKCLYYDFFTIGYFLNSYSLPRNKIFKTNN
jgi:hypothetical protein